MSDAWNVVQSVPGAAVNFVGQVTTTVVQAGQAVVGTIARGTISAASWAVQTVKSTWSNVVAGANVVWNRITTAADWATSEISSVITTTSDVIRGLAIGGLRVAVDIAWSAWRSATATADFLVEHAQLLQAGVDAICLVLCVIFPPAALILGPISLGLGLLSLYKDASTSDDKDWLQIGLDVVGIFAGAIGIEATKLARVADHAADKALQAANSVFASSESLIAFRVFKSDREIAAELFVVGLGAVVPPSLQLARLERAVLVAQATDTARLATRLDEFGTRLNLFSFKYFDVPGLLLNLLKDHGVPDFMQQALSSRRHPQTKLQRLGGLPAQPAFLAPRPLRHLAAFRATRHKSGRDRVRRR